MGEWRRGPKANSPSWFWSDNFVASINHLTRSPEMVGVTEFGYGMMSSSAHFLFLLRHPTAAMATNERCDEKWIRPAKEQKKDEIICNALNSCVRFQHFRVPPEIPFPTLHFHYFSFVSACTQRFIRIHWTRFGLGAAISWPISRLTHAGPGATNWVAIRNPQSETVNTWAVIIAREMRTFKCIKDKPGRWFDFCFQRPSQNRNVRVLADDSFSSSFNTLFQLDSGMCWCILQTRG